MNRAALIFGLVCMLAGIVGLSCYDTTKPPPPCTVGGGDGCYPLVHDMKRSNDGGQ